MIVEPVEEMNTSHLQQHLTFPSVASTAAQAEDLLSCLEYYVKNRVTMDRKLESVPVVASHDLALSTHLEGWVTLYIIIYHKLVINHSALSYVKHRLLFNMS